MEIGVEYHFRWNRLSIERIARALESYNSLFLGDVMSAVNPDEILRFSERISIAVVVFRFRTACWKSNPISWNRARSIWSIDGTLATIWTKLFLTTVAWAVLMISDNHANVGSVGETLWEEIYLWRKAPSYPNPSHWSINLRNFDISILSRENYYQ